MSSGHRSLGIVSSEAPSPASAGELSAEAKRAALEEVLETSIFQRAEQLRKFLNFICEMEIAGRGSELCEYLIGVEALGRPTNYSPTEDAAVRRRAQDLRMKLQEVYGEELAGRRVRIHLPKRTYIPRFVTDETSLLRVRRPLLSPAFSIRPPAPQISFVVGLTVAFLLGVLITGFAMVKVPRLRSFFAGTGADMPHPGIIYEAESAGNTLNGAVEVKKCLACSGGQKVGYIGDGAANFVALEEPDVPQSGPYQVEIDYLVNGTRSFFISVNDGPGLELPLTGNTWLFPAHASMTLNLKAGKNRIVFYNDKEYAPDLDRIVLR